MAGRYRMVFLYGLVSESRFSGSRGFTDFSNDAKARVRQHSVQTNPGGGVFSHFFQGATARALGPTETVCE